MYSTGYYMFICRYMHIYGSVMKEIIKIYKALSDESRLRVLNLLFRRECCVCEVEQVLDVSQSKASRMLSALMNAGLLSHRQEGLWSLYSIDWDSMDDKQRAILKAVQQGFEGDLRMKTDLEALEAAVLSGTGCPITCCRTEEI